MDPYSAGFVIAMVLVSGFVAYYADILGRRLGKKRLRLGNLRPRHTAAIMVLLAGMGITAATIGILYATSTPVREWLMQGRQIQAKLERAQSRLSDAEDDLAQSRDELTAARDRLSSTEDELGAAEGDLVEAEGAVAAAKERLADAEAEANRLMREAAQLRASVAAFEKTLAQTKQQLAQLQADAETLRSSNASIASDNNALNIRNLELEQRIQGFEATLEQRQADLDELDRQRDELQAQYETLQEQATSNIQILTDRITKGQEELAGLTGTLANLQSEIATLQTTKDQLLGQVGSARMSPLIFNRGDELARVATRERMNFLEARKFILALLENASDEAEERGAQPRESDGAVVAIPEILTPDLPPIPAAQTFERLIETISGEDESQLLIARALFNTFEDEWVPVAIVIYPNPIVYQDGEVIAEQQLDTRRNEEAIAAEIQAFIAEVLVQEALDDGMIPRVGQDFALGEIPTDEMLNLVRDLRALNTRLRLQYIAANETRAGDPIDLEFRFR